MFRAIILNMVIFTLIGCNEKHDNVVLFKNHIGQNNYNFIIELMEVFEDKIGALTEDNPYDYFLRETVENDLTRKDWFDSIHDFRTLYRQLNDKGFLNDFFLSPSKVEFDSGLLITTYDFFDVYLQDSVKWIDSIYVKSRFTDYSYEWDTAWENENVIIDILYDKEPPTISYSDFLDEKSKELKFNYYSKILSGLANYSNDTLIKSYLDAKTSDGYIELAAFADTWLKASPDYNDFFVKIVTIIELFSY